MGGVFFVNALKFIDKGGKSVGKFGLVGEVVLVGKVAAAAAEDFAYGCGLEEGVFWVDAVFAEEGFDVVAGEDSAAGEGVCFNIELPVSLCEENK